MSSSLSAGLRCDKGNEGSVLGIVSSPFEPRTARPQFPLPPLIVGHRDTERAPESSGVAMVPQVGKLVSDDVVEQRHRSLHDAPVHSDDPCRAATRPATLLRRDDDLRLSDTELSTPPHHTLV